MIKKILGGVTIGASATLIITIIVVLLVTFTNISDNKSYSAVMGKVVAKAGINPEIISPSAGSNGLFIVLKVHDEYVRLECNITRFNSTEIGDMIKLKRVEYKPKLGETDIYYDYY